MRIVLSLLVAAAVSVALPAAADEAEPGPAVGPGTGAALAPSNAHTLAGVHGGLTADSARVAGRSRDIEMSAGKGAAKVVRPAPTPRVLRKMTPERVIAAIDPGVRACGSASTNPAATTFGLRVSVAPGGEVEGSELASSMRVPPALLACVTNAVSAARFGAPGAAGASIVLPITVPGRAAAAAAPADTTSVTMTAPAPTPAPVAAAEAKPEEVASKQ